MINTHRGEATILVCCDVFTKLRLSSVEQNHKAQIKYLWSASIKRKSRKTHLFHSEMI